MTMPDGWMGGSMEGWMDGWIDGCMDRWMAGWMDPPPETA